MKNQDVPGVIGHVGTVLGKNEINIANFSLGRRDAPLKPGEPLEALAIVESDTAVPETVLAQLKQNPAVMVARAVDFARLREAIGRPSSAIGEAVRSEGRWLGTGRRPGLRPA